ncbi:MAG: uroporphyrinogen-III synthase [Aigarchaeota archaeon]|nr:uroporphyrinogen-III synthase [Aigarchaeota archaeon]MCX8192528.1 uroporphyrinogen-III synthase [Nitrososphaeria archaeon]MDW7985736.1 uroporphyrinogen-III synthase [Nitrososphaerota archaeon]
MTRDLVVILPGTVSTSRNIVKSLADLEVSIKIIPILKVKIDREVVKTANRVLSQITGIEYSVFTSKTAVEIVHDLIPIAWRYARIRSVAIGPGTASLLNSLGAESIDIPIKHSSEGLIEFLKRVPSSASVALYCSSFVDQSLEDFINHVFLQKYIFKLYNISGSRKSIDQIVELVESNPSKTFLIILTSLQILRILSEDGRLRSLSNVFFSTISKRISDEAVRLKFPISHSSQIDRIDEYYVELKKYITNLLKRIQSG